MMRYKNLMVDLETLGTKPGCVVLSIGAAVFHQGGVGNVFYEEIDMLDSIDFGLDVSPQTMQWWEKQDASASGLLSRCRDGGIPVITALHKLNQFIGENCAEGFRIWGNGASFDEPVLSAVYQACSCETPWKYWQSACYRTLKDLVKSRLPEPRFSGVKHNALDDAVHQAKHAVNALELIGGW